MANTLALITILDGDINSPPEYHRILVSVEEVIHYGHYLLKGIPPTLNPHSGVVTRKNFIFMCAPRAERFSQEIRIFSLRSLNA